MQSHSSSSIISPCEISPPTTSFSELSLQLTRSLTSQEKTDGGIFFTPPSCVQRIVTLLRGVSTTIQHILEPSCGSGEFITAMAREYPDATITGVEFHPAIYEAVSKKFAGAGAGAGTSGGVRIHHADFLKYNSASDSPPDLIIGNPPYFVMKKNEVESEYYPYFDGRPNIFILFIMKCAKMLRVGGVMSFVLPSSFMNSQYYDKTRKYIVRHFAVLHIVRCGDASCDDPLASSAKRTGYLDTQQDTIILIIQKHDGGSDGAAQKKHQQQQHRFALEKYGATIFTDNLPRLSALYTGSKSLHELGFKVNIGTVVWNQCKNILTDDPSKTLLIYSSNIENGQFVHKTYKNPEKKAFIDKPGIRRPMIVLNRGWGVGEYKFEYCFITPNTTANTAYLIENHLICITLDDAMTGTEHGGGGDGGDGGELAAFHSIIRSFNDPRTKEFISCYCGNSAINATELNHMLPIYT